MPPSAAPSRPVNFVLRRIWFSRLFVFMLLYGDARPWPFTPWCILPAGEHGPRGFDLVIGDLPCRVFPVWYGSRWGDFQRPRYPSWLATPCGFTTRIYELDISMLVA